MESRRPPAGDPTGERLASLQQLLATMPLFQDVPATSIADLLPHFQAHDLPAGAVLVRQGEQGDALFLVEEGTLVVTAEMAGRDVRLGALGPGDFFGEMSMLRNAPRSATVTTGTAARLWSLARADLIQIVRQFPVVGTRLQETMRQRDIANAIHALQ